MHFFFFAPTLIPFPSGIGGSDGARRSRHMAAAPYVPTSTIQLEYTPSPRHGKIGGGCGGKSVAHSFSAPISDHRLEADRGRVVVTCHVSVSVSCSDSLSDFAAD